MDESVRALVDEAAIARRIVDYCRAMDRCDTALGHAVFWPEATCDYGAIFTGRGRDFVDHAIARHAAMENHQHRVSNILIRLDGDVAGSEAYVDARFRAVAEGQTIERATRGRYLDRWARRAGRWAIVHRRYIHETDETRPVGPARFPAEGRRDREDESYALIG